MAEPVDPAIRTTPDPELENKIDPERKSAITKIFCLTAADAFQAPTFDRYTGRVLVLGGWT